MKTFKLIGNIKYLNFLFKIIMINKKNKCKLNKYILNKSNDKYIFT